MEELGLLIVGLDGADPEIAKKAEMPNLKSIGRIREIKTYPNSGPAWASLVTGSPPSEHGIGVINPYTSLSDLKTTPFWERIEAKVGIVNLPIADRPPKVDGWFIAGFLCPSVLKCAYPKPLSKELLRRGYEIAIEGERLNGAPEVGNKLLRKEYERIIQKRTRIFKRLLNERPVDLGFIVYRCLDTIQHRIMHDEESVLEWYAKMDGELEKLLKLDYERVVVLSDHGFRKARPTLDSINFFLSNLFRAIKTQNKSESKFLKEFLENKVKNVFRPRKNRPVITGEHRPVALFASNTRHRPQRIEEALIPLLNKEREFCN